MVYVKSDNPNNPNELVKYEFDHNNPKPIQGLELEVLYTSYKTLKESIAIGYELIESPNSYNPMVATWIEVLEGIGTEMHTAVCCLEETS